MKQILLLNSLICIYIGSIAQCENNLSFKSYSQAISIITSNHHNVVASLPAGKSSWIVSAKYYSCDAQSGYLIYSTRKGHVYIHQGVPYRVWRGFVSASSSGVYYNNNVRGKYLLRLL